MDYETRQLVTLKINKYIEKIFDDKSVSFTICNVYICHIFLKGLHYLEKINKLPLNFELIATTGLQKVISKVSRTGNKEQKLLAKMMLSKWRHGSFNGMSCKSISDIVPESDNKSSRKRKSSIIECVDMKKCKKEDSSVVVSKSYNKNSTSNKRRTNIVHSEEMKEVFQVSDTKIVIRRVSQERDENGKIKEGHVPIVKNNDKKTTNKVLTNNGLKKKGYLMAKTVKMLKNRCL
uniref:TFIIS N-terminal domain-containing protein n=1 Tax=Parastrongyloides trichosuri TaxID=131310 RepID=A0A0N5A6J0_PARTI